MGIKIGNRMVDEDEPCFIIAEAGVNHNGDIDLAKKLIDIAKDAGADTVKFQTFRVEELMIKRTPKAKYQEETTGKGSQFEMMKKLELTEKDFKELAKYAIRQGIMFLSTPFDEKSADLLEELNVPAFKIGSGDLTNIPLLKHVAKKGKPMTISTGMSTLEEVRDAVDTVKNAGNSQIILLHCTSNYPARIESCNLRVMQTLKREFNLPVGYSDHTLGITVPIAAVALGACLIEKHFTLDKNLLGPDHKASLEPSELKEMVKQIRLVEKTLGSPEKKPVESEKEIMKIVRKSIVAKQGIEKGSIITENMLVIKRPGTGLAPSYIDRIVGKKAKRDIAKDEILDLKMVE